MIYTIKPLEWEGDAEKMCDWEGLKARTPFGSYEILLRRDPREWESPVQLHYCFDEYYDEGVIDADSVEHAKELAWQDWTKRLEGALIPCVFDTAEVRTVPIHISNPINADDKTMKQLVKFFSDSAFYTNGLNP